MVFRKILPKLGEIFFEKLNFAAKMYDFVVMGEMNNKNNSNLCKTLNKTIIDS
eukprot:GAHX01001029.1.p2 GENE.GAHX01001029.1~~GAHX01001029.1.p2  ORF type:complete len:53 (+),score=4.64 GAHX01001029.1:406-564(+)